MYEGSYHLRGSYTKLTAEWDIAPRIPFIVPLQILDLKVYRLSVLTKTTLTIPWLTDQSREEGRIEKRKGHGNKKL